MSVGVAFKTRKKRDVHVRTTKDVRAMSDQLSSERTGYDIRRLHDILAGGRALGLAVGDAHVRQHATRGGGVHCRQECLRLVFKL